MSTPPAQGAIRGTAVFVDRREPSLMAGVYTVQVTHTVHSADGTTVPANSADTTFTSAERRFAVRGERFSLDPAEIVMVFPPRDNQGEYHNTLPHVVCSRRTLPWERTADLTASFDDGPPWLALLLFDEDEAPTPNVGTVSDLLSPPANVRSYASAFSFALEYDEQGADPCTTIDVPTALFAELAPRVADLAWLTHVRWVGGPGDTYDPAGSAAQEQAVIVGHRFPQRNARSTVHLVSLEGMAPLLPTDPAPPAPADDGGAVRLVSLASWSFTSADPTETFAGYLENISVGPMMRPLPASPTSSSPPSSTGSPTGSSTDDQLATVATAFALGYTALPHTTRLADSTVSWYRGPLLPAAVDPGIVPPPDGTGDNLVTTADEALRFDPSTGMFDVSYAAAWQLGRLLALGSGTFSTAMVTWRRGLLATTAAAVSPVPAGTAPLQSMAQAVRSGAAAVTGSGQAQARALQAAVADPAQLQSLVGEVTVPAPVACWLTALTQLTGIPIPYLVPDAAMLPPESIRFFQLDPNWIVALLGGATSVGRTSTADLQHDRAVAAAVHEQAVSEPVVSGFILRSAVVDGWPEIDVVTYADPAAEITPATVPLPNLRVETIAPGILLGLVAGLIGQVHLHEPAVGLHFGVDMDQQGNLLPDKTLRALTGAMDGQQSQPAPAPLAYRGDPARRVLDTQALAGTIQASVPAGQFTAAEFALEMVEGVQSVKFVAGGS